MSDGAVHKPQKSSATAAKAAGSAYVWDLPTRLFHWGLVSCVVAAWWTGGTGNAIHEILGYTIAGLVAFRVLWGFTGTTYAKFYSFIYSPLSIFRYIAGLFSGNAERYLGHNPAAGLMIFAIIALLITLTATGIMMRTVMFFGVTWVEKTHGYAAAALLIMIMLHILGVVLSSLAHGENLVVAMLTGYKKRLQTKGPPGENSDDFGLGILQRIRGTEGLIFLLIAVVAGGTYGWIATSGRVVTIMEEPAAQVAAAMVPKSQRSAPSEDNQDRLMGGPELASRPWLVASGGRLYDNWYVALATTPPSETHPSWPSSNKSMAGAETWRCVSCHGWDYQGSVEPVRQSWPQGGTVSMIGVRNAATRSVEDIISLLGNRTHQYSDRLLPMQAKYRLALFIASGQHTIDTHLRENGLARAETGKGRPLFQNMCASCHGFDGKSQKFTLTLPQKSFEAGALYLGAVANENPAKVLHKLRNGHPGTPMIAMRAFPMNASVELLAYVQSLPPS